ncbi:MAG: type secretion system protein [Acidobacteriota bacterium]|jgi:type VI secretion system protein|nr:type secretion system protein [Acidobacteriota bacterium]
MRALAAVCVAALAVVFTGCPKAPKVVTKRLPGGPKESKIEVSVQVSPHANGGNPVALDLLLVSDKELLKQLQGMTAGEWFEKRAQIILDHPQVGALVVSSWEWVPGQVIQLNEVKVAPEVRAAVIFANYFNPGEHRAVLDPRKDVRIKLGEDKLEASQVKH